MIKFIISTMVLVTTVYAFYEVCKKIHKRYLKWKDKNVRN